MMPRLLPLAGCLALILLSGCKEDPAPPPPDVAADSCDHAPFDALIGQPRNALEGMDMPERTRIISPHDMITEDFRPDRLNISLDKDGRISRVWCG